MPSPMVKIYERASGWVAELWAVSDDGDDVREEALLEIYACHPRLLDAIERAESALRRAVDKDGGSR